MPRLRGVSTARGGPVRGGPAYLAAMLAALLSPSVNAEPPPRAKEPKKAPHRRRKQRTPRTRRGGKS